MSGCKIKSNARKSGVGCLLRCLLHTSSELLRGVWVPRTATLLRVPLFKFVSSSPSGKQPQAYNKSSHWVLVATPSEESR